MALPLPRERYYCLVRSGSRLCLSLLFEFSRTKNRVSSSRQGNFGNRPLRVDPPS